jgi:Putative beta-barrel porin-2, OmpL-like. bbp2
MKGRVELMRKSLLGAFAITSSLVLVSATAFADQSAGNATPVDGGQQSIAPKAPTQNAPASQPTPSHPGFIERLFDAYADGFNQPPPAPAGQSAEAPAGRRPLPFPPAPLDAPWPWPDWPFGGTPLLGGATPNSSGDNLMKALSATSVGDFLKDNNVELYGWVDAGVNLSTSRGANGNAPAGYDFNANAVQLNQAVLYIDRVPDTVQQDHVDWGFRVVGLYGTDYREVTMEGLFSKQLTKYNDLYGYTPAEFDVDIYFPWIGQGSDLKVGRYVTLPDIEADLDLQNVFDTHSLYYTYDPFTQMGFVWSTRLSENWMVQAGLNASNDTAIWAEGARLTFTACVQYNSNSSRDSIYLCDNGTNDAKYGFNNVNFYVATWFHKITDRLWVATEDYYEYQIDVPALGQPTIPGANPALCRTGTKCTAGAVATAFYTMYQLTDTDYVGMRNEGFDDVRGQRTGFATWYSETTFGWTHWFSKSIELRPEIRFDHSYTAAAYDNGTKHSQLQLAADILIKF